ncbi:hypothetical protein [Roseicyclus mahoneyensis]|uniref:Uncharacterized protein n=1 Tax=Roseicyclus mahoneyensis TaxID=164332 RepID=A0A316GK49_9RHOB|nr:hypothetical protein [Roseicyclus mahoneyensis]PWK60577.1 hypothetical protein C7455_104214 [Roseicyclus mahoneyensis]
MLIVSDTTTSNRGVLETRSLPRKFLGRVQLLPRRAGLGLWLRLIVEMQLLRYLFALLPFVIMPLVARDTAAPIMQAPLAMVVVIGLVEMKVLRLSKAGRARAVDADEAARRLDTLAFRAKGCLRKIAARHEVTEGELRLVIEQSELARVPPLTLVSVQTDQPAPRLFSLDAEDRAALVMLFDKDLTERDLLAVNHRDDLYIRDIAQEARAVSAHARLAAALEKRAATA